MHIVKYRYQVWMNQVKYCRCDSLVWSQGSIVWLPGRRLHFWEDFFWKLAENYIESYLNLEPWFSTCSGWPPWQHVSTWEYNRPDPCQDEARRSDWSSSWLGSLSVDVWFSKILFTSLTLLYTVMLPLPPYSCWQGSGKNGTSHNQHNHFTAYCYTIE